MAIIKLKTNQVIEVVESISTIENEMIRLRLGYPNVYDRILNVTLTGTSKSIISIMYIEIVYYAGKK